MSKKSIPRLQKAAFELIKLIDKDLENGNAPEGMFRISATKEVIDEQMKKINATGKADIEKLSQLERAALLKQVLRDLRKETNSPLLQYNEGITAIDSIKMSSVENQAIASNLFKLLAKVASLKETTAMTPATLATSITPSLIDDSLNDIKRKDLTAIIKNTQQIVSDLVKSPPEVSLALQSTHYKHTADDAKPGRSHSREVDGASEKFKDLKAELQGLKGDHLKCKILEQFKGELEKINTKQGVIDWLADKKASSVEYKVLATGQDFMTRTFHLETSSIKALNEMVEEQKQHIEILGPPEDSPSPAP